MIVLHKVPIFFILGDRLNRPPVTNLHIPLPTTTLQKLNKNLLPPNIPIRAWDIHSSDLFDKQVGWWLAEISAVIRSSTLLICWRFLLRIWESRKDEQDNIDHTSRFSQWIGSVFFEKFRDIMSGDSRFLSGNVQSVFSSRNGSEALDLRDEVYQKELAHCLKMVGTPRCYFRGAGKVKIGGVVDSGVILDDKVLVASFTARTDFVLPFDGNARLLSVHLRLTTTGFRAIFRDCRIESHRFYRAQVLVTTSFPDGTIFVDPSEWAGPKVIETTIRSARSGDLYVDLSKIPDVTELVLRGSRKLGEITDGRIRIAVKTQECFIETLNPPLSGESEHQIIAYFTTPFVRRWD